MKKNIFLTLILTIILMLSSCAESSLVFRNHKYGDTIDEIIETEQGTPEKEDINGRVFVTYYNIEIYGYIGNLEYIFNGDELEQIFYYITSYCELISVEDAYKKLIDEYDNYGDIVKNEINDNGIHKALLKKGETGIVLAVNKSNYVVSFHQYYNKSEIFYDTLSVADLF